MIIYVYVLSAVIGLCVGSFLNVVIYRVPRNMSLIKPNSHCTNCNYQLKWYDNIPVLSYIFLGGKCRKCKTHISFRYTIVELLNSALWLLSAILFWENSPLISIATMLFCSLLICIGFIDFETTYVYDAMSYLLIVPILLTIIADYSNWLEYLLGLAIGGGFFLFFWAVFKYIAKKDALGIGDIILMAFVGGFLGWKKVLLAILISSVVAFIVIIPLHYSKNKTADKEYPFAPFLALGSIIASLFGQPIISWYLSLFFI